MSIPWQLFIPRLPSAFVNSKNPSGACLIRFQLICIGVGLHSAFAELPEPHLGLVRENGQVFVDVEFAQLADFSSTGNFELLASEDLLNWTNEPGEVTSTDITGESIDFVTMRFPAQETRGKFFCLDFDYDNARLAGAGVYSWAGWNKNHINKDDCPHLRGVPLILRWSNLEVNQGDYRFEDQLGSKLQDADDRDLDVFLMVWVALDDMTPEWLFDAGVPKVFTDSTVNPLGEPVSNRYFPYYFSSLYRERFFKLHEELGMYVRSLPPALRERIRFIQSAEGSTGDGQPYKGDPLNPEYEISKSDWNDFRLEVWQFIQAQHPTLPIVVNGDANEDQQYDWMINNLDPIGLKHGMFSHGFHVSENIQRLEGFEEIISKARAAGKEVFTRGEMDAEMITYGWSTRNIPQSLYWSGLMASHTMLDVWNIPQAQLAVEANWPATEFFNKYAGYHHANRSPKAFCALRNGLNAADFFRFPASEFGGEEGNKKDVQRYLNIAAAFADYGAVQEDPDKAIGGGMINRKRQGRNDVGWNIFPGNYKRFLTQLNPGSGDVGFWTVDETIYGRFARGFEHISGKTKMVFKLDPEFFVYPEKPKSVVLSITWLDKGNGQWSLSYIDGAGLTQNIVVNNTDANIWKTRQFQLEAATFSGTLEGGDLVLDYEAGDDTIFHMLELER